MNSPIEMVGIVHNFFCPIEMVGIVNDFFCPMHELVASVTKFLMNHFLVMLNVLLV